MSQDFWKDRNVLVTGGTGMLGSELVIQLINKQANVTLIARGRESKSRVFLERVDKHVNIIQGDVTDFGLVERIVGKYMVDTIFHLAAQTIAGRAKESPIATFNSNIRGTWNVLEAARKRSSHIRSVVVASSERVYGDQRNVPYNEHTTLQGTDPYAVSKSCAELIAGSYYRTYDLPVSIVRCSNIFGPGDLNLDRLVPGTILSLLRGKSPIIRSDGKAVRGFLYVKDAAEGYLSVSSQVDKSAGQVFNLAPLERHSVLEIVQSMVDLLNPELPLIVKGETADKIKEQYLAIDKARLALSWYPRYSLREALRETINWYKEHFTPPQSRVGVVSSLTAPGGDVSKIPVVIFCGGSGTRLREETHDKPKPMVDVGGKPLLWHVVKIYRHYGFRRFLLTLGYKGEYIRDFFKNGNGYIFGDCDIQLIDTGEGTPTGGRLLRSAHRLNSDIFMCTYGDGVSDLNVTKVLEHHQNFGDVVGTITSVRVPHKFGIISFSESGKLQNYSKGHLMNEPINAGFMVFERSFLNCLNDSMAVEEPFNNLASQGKLGVHYHNGYFYAVDTYRDLEVLNEAWENGAPWKVWT